MPLLSKRMCRFRGTSGVTTRDLGRMWIRAAILAALALRAAPAMHAQGVAPSSSADSSGRLVGHVLYQDQTVGVPYASVTLTPTGGSRFADSSGAFFFAHLEPRPYHVRARQIGFAPFDTTVVVRPGPAITSITLHIHRVQVRLAQVTIRAKGPPECVKPGIPDSTVDPLLATLFAQVRENVARLRILMNDYPFRYRREEEFLVRQRGASDQIVEMDTIQIESWVEEPYQPGRVIVNGVSRHGQPTQFMHLAQFQDLADPNFDETHCFRIADRDKSDDPHQLLEIDFRPWVGLNVPDVEGAVFLDPERLIVKSERFHLTRSNETTPPIRDWTYYSSFHEIVPLVPIVSGFQSYVQTRQPGTMIEDGRNLDVSFVRDAPVDQSVRDTLVGAATAHLIVAKVAFGSNGGPPCSPPLPQTVVEALTGRVLGSKDAYADPSWRTAARTLLTDMQAHLAIPSTVDLTTFGYAAPASAADAAGRGALRIAPGIFGRYAVAFDAAGSVRDARVIATSRSADVDSAVVDAARGLVNIHFGGQTVAISVSTAHAADTTTGVVFAHIQVPSWLASRQATQAATPGAVSPADPPVRSADGDTTIVEFIVDEDGHVDMSTVHRVDAASDGLTHPDRDALTATAAEALNTQTFRPAMIGRCTVSQVATQQFVFPRRD